MNYGLPYTYIDCLAANATNLFAGTQNGGVFRWDSGRWTAANTGFPFYLPAIHSLAASDAYVFAGTDSGVYVSTNNGDTWTAANTGLPNTRITSLCVSGPYLLAGSIWDSGLWRRPVSEMVSVKDQSSEVPAEFILEQNYPNPFNPSTTIKFELPRASQVTLTVCDVLGRQVSMLVNERMNAAVHEVKFSAKGGSASGGDGFNLASGVYFYRLQAGGFVQTRKFVLLR
jgi:hypothetical protein